MRIAMIQLCRAGDLVSILPVAKFFADNGHEVTFVTSSEFSAILEPCSYVKVRHYDTHLRAVAAAAEAIKDEGFDQIIRCQVDGNETPVSQDVGNFVLQQWVRAGMLDRFHDLPLVFDSRDAAGEAKALEIHLPKEDGRPLLLTNFKGHSSKYEHAQTQKKWVNETFGEDWRILHLGDICLRKIHHLLAFLEKADCLFTVDTLTLHLAYATMTPTIAMSVETPWYQSEPRKHWLYRCTYPQSITDKHRAEIKRIIDEKDFALGRMIQPMPTPLSDEVIHVVDWFTGNTNDNKRIFNARRTWDAIAARDTNYRLVEHQLKEGQRSSRDIGDKKRVPYINDIIDFGAEQASDDDIVVFTNSDVCLVPEALRQIRAKLANADCCYSRRVDVQDNSKPMMLSDLKNQTAHVGADLFAMRAKFWRENRDAIPLLYLSFEGWDWVCRHWMRTYELNPEMSPPIIYHGRHVSYWTSPFVILSSPAQLHNRRECEAWARANGLSEAIYSESDNTNFLFKPDGVDPAR